MATSLGATVKVNVNATLTNTVDIGTTDYKINELVSKQFTNGTTTGLANALWSDTRSIGSSANDDLDLAGVLTDVYGAALTFTTIKGILIEANAANANNLILGGDTSANIQGLFGDDSDTMIIPPGGSYLYLNTTTGITVTATTADKLRLTNGGTGTISYKIILIGTKA